VFSQKGAFSYKIHLKKGAFSYKIHPQKGAFSKNQQFLIRKQEVILFGVFSVLALFLHLLTILLKK
jgi:hypothetical protein